MSNSPKADKQFGQHFLSNQGVIDRIAMSVMSLQEKLPEARAKAPIVEIGPGPGALTKELLARARPLSTKLLAVELDTRMVDHLQLQYSKDIEAQNFEVIHGDAVEADWLVSPLMEAGVVCGNLPYNVGTAIVFKLVEYAPQAQAFCFMLQKEVVQRFMAVPSTKDYGVPSIMLQLVCAIGDHFWVQPGSFSPPPKVQSGVFTFRRRAKFLSPELDPFHPETQYFAFNKRVKLAFQSRRKMLRKVFPALKDTEWGAKRPEALSPEEWWSLWQDDLLK
ncbi:ribosomal RNA small subunit methyltransferase A [bacterium]|nr:ribosomal RNA small subunit methyltransferase A [bacterium]